MIFGKGDIVLPTTRVDWKDRLNGLYHPAVVWDDVYDEGTDFSGIMLTHSKPTKRFMNILMSANHFETGYNLESSNTHFVNQLFVKFHSWGPFDLVGRLTTAGIVFIEDHLDSVQSMEFIVYVNAAMTK